MYRKGTVGISIFVFWPRPRLQTLQNLRRDMLWQVSIAPETHQTLSGFRSNPTLHDINIVRVEELSDRVSADLSQVLISDFFEDYFNHRLAGSIDIPRALFRAHMVSDIIARNG